MTAPILHDAPVPLTAPKRRPRGRLAARHGSLTFDFRSKPGVPPEQRFYELVSPEPNTGCWLWLGSTQPLGYGTICMWVDGKKRNFPAHRFSLELKLGRRLVKGECACHRCDFPPCVNPDHLFLGSHKENMADMVRKKRHAFGEHNGHSRFTVAQVVAIRRLVELGITQQLLADAVGCTREHIRDLSSGRRWAQVPLDQPQGEVQP